MSNPTGLEEKNNEWLATIMEKADLFDYLCWLENLEVKELGLSQENAPYICMRMDGKSFFGETYIDAVRRAAKYDKNNSPD